jgi:N-acetylglucosaminyldiphosphoundecaprenol N-acetyl-beta-D-mannosaminyltransferase
MNSEKLAVSRSNTLANPRTSIPRANVLGVGVHAVDLLRATEIIEQAIESDRRGYVCVTGVHGVMEAQREAAIRQVLADALLVTPDGMPTVWVGRTQGFRQMRRVFGPELMLHVCQQSVKKGFSHFLYGGKPGVADQLQTSLRGRFPGIRIVGTFTPPFRSLLPEELLQLEERMQHLKPDLVWVGLSTPKQEIFMAENIRRLTCKVMVGVGAAFDIHVGLVNDAPRWMKNGGLQWLHRLYQEPERLWKRYLVNNSGFLWRIALQLSGLRSYELCSELQSRD